MSNDGFITLNFQVLGQDESDSLNVPLSSTIQDIKIEACSAWDDLTQDDIDIYMPAIGESLRVNEENVQMISKARHPPQPFLRNVITRPKYRPFKTPPPDGELHFFVHINYSITYQAVVPELGPIISTIKIHPSGTVANLKDKILQEHPSLCGFSPYMQLLQVSIPLKGLRASSKIGSQIRDADGLSPPIILLDVFEEPPSKRHLHIIVYYETLNFWVLGDDPDEVHSIAFRPTDTVQTLRRRIWDEVAKDLLPNTTMAKIQLHKISVAYTNLEVLANAVVLDDVPVKETLFEMQPLNHYFGESPPPSEHVHIMVTGPLGEARDGSAGEDEEDLPSIFHRRDIEGFMDRMKLVYDGSMFGHPHVAAAISRVDNQPYFIKYHPESNLNEVNILKILSKEVSPDNPIPPGLAFRHLSDGVLILSLHGGRKIHRHEHLSRDLSTIVRDLIHGVAFLHANKVVHNDLKPSNILVHSTTGRLSIIDYDLADSNIDERMFVDGFTGTQGWTAPEVGGEKPYNLMKAEVWALGNIVRHLCEACPDSEHREPLLQLSVGLMDPKPKMRPSMKEVVKLMDGYIASLKHVEQ